MALRRALARRFFNISSRKSSPNNASISKANFHRDFITSPSSPDSANNSFFQRFLQLRATSQSASFLPEFLNIPVGDKLREKLNSVNANIPDNNFGRLNGLTPPVTPTNQVNDVASSNGMTSIEARKVLLAWRMEVVKTKLREFRVSSITHGEYVRICEEASGDEAMGLEIAKNLDLSGHVIVLGNIVFLRPDQVIKSVEKLMCQSIAKANDPKRMELEEMEKVKAIIDRKAESLVKSELYGGLAFFVIQTLGFMRLTFWELSWDVMEPICFFTSSLYFGLAYVFFLRTSTEPSWEGYFRRRFVAKQRKLMKLQNFDIDRYNYLCGTFYPNVYNQINHGMDHATENFRCSR